MKRDADWFRAKRDEALAACQKERRRCNRAIRIIAKRDRTIMKMDKELHKLRAIRDNLKQSAADFSRLQVYRRNVPLKTSRELK